MGQVVERQCLAQFLKPHRDAGQTIVFTNGCFDLLHIGHVRYLAEAKRYGDVLVVGVNSDSSVQRLKGPRRPLIPETERAEMLAHLCSVDYVTLFDELTADRLIEEVIPHVYVKGGDIDPARIPEAPTVQRLGGRVVIAQYVDAHSTSRIIARVLSAYDAANG